MARLNDTVVHGLIDVFDGYYITEKKHKLAIIQDNTLLLADIGLNTTLRGINMLIEGTGTGDIRTQRQITIDSAIEGVDINAGGGDINVIAERSAKLQAKGGTLDVLSTGDMTLDSSLGKFSQHSKGNIDMKSDDGHYTMESNGDIDLKSSNGHYDLNVRNDITETSSGGKKSVHVNGNIEEKSDNG